MAAVTIADLIRDRRLLWVYCRECGRERDVDPTTLPLPSEYPVPDVGKRRCSACGSRKIHTAPEFYPGGIEAMRSKWGGRPASRRDSSSSQPSSAGQAPWPPAS